MQFRNDIQGLRALAFILVFIFHISSSWLAGGFLGVDIFFVISGYLMTNIIVKSIENKKFNYYQFLIKRIKRIVPAYYFFLILTLLACGYFYLYTDLISFKDIVLRTALFISNITFSTGNNYFGSALSQNPLLHTWSLSVEMQFYLVLPLLLLIFRKHVVKLLILLTIILTLYSSYQIYFLDNKTSMYFSLIARFPEFLIGGIFSQIFKKNINISRTYNNLIACTSLVILLICCFNITEKTPFPGFIALIPCLATGIILSIENNFVSDFLSKKIPVYIGELSYSLYLWHFPLIAFIRYKNNSYDLSSYEIITVGILTFGFAWVSYTFIENKFRKITDLNLYKIFIPAYILLFAFCFYLPTLAKFKKIPEIYSEPFFGMKSHSANQVEKFGDLQKNDSIVLIGDSHALMLKPFFNEIGKKNNFSFYTLTTNSYPAISGIDIKEITSDRIPPFRTSQEFIEPTKKLIKENQYIILCINGLKSPRSAYTAIEKLIKTLRPNQHLILISTYPILDKNPLVLNMNITRKSSFKFSELDNTKNFEILKKISEKHINVHLYNINKGIIRENLGYINNTIAYYNESHINTFASMKMGQEMNDDFMKFFNILRDKNIK